MIDRPGVTERVEPSHTVATYLRILFELDEDGFPPLRARITERVGHALASVSQNVARLARDGLVHLDDERQVLLTPDGRWEAALAMRRHRLVECLLAETLGFDWHRVHLEASRWGNGISVDAERAIAARLLPPYLSPYGNGIPALDLLGIPDLDLRGESSRSSGVERTLPLLALAQAVTVGTPAVVVRIGERLQGDPEALLRLSRSCLLPGRTIQVLPGGWGQGVDVSTAVSSSRWEQAAARHIFVCANSGPR